jgi:broad specificity phosphatase PhoE
VKEYKITIYKPFYFVRHGQTDFNKEHRISGSINIPLNEEGKKQALEAAKSLKNKKIDLIITSPMIRAKETAEIISKSIDIPTIIYNEGLKEANWGIIEGKPISEIQSQLDYWVDGGDIDKSENIKDFRIRIAATFNEILDKYNNFLIVSHGALYGNLMEIIGNEYQKTNNAVPYYFEPKLVNSDLRYIVEPVNYN